MTDSEQRTRTETDSLGDIEVPAQAHWGAQTQRALENFPSIAPMPGGFVRTVALIKACAARVNGELELLDQPRVEAIEAAAMRIIKGELADQFPVDRYQTGSGTSTNMNVNEVIARLASSDDLTVHPNDHVNLGQSSNDTIPSAIHISVVMDVYGRLLPVLEQLDRELARRAEELADVVKPGRTHLMDAMPVTFGQVLGGWRDQIEFARARLVQAAEACQELPQGGTAVGTGVNTHERFARLFTAELSRRTDVPFSPMATSFAGQGAIDRPASVSAALRGLALVLAKITDDLRWMASGPQHGINEITLPKLQPGSSIMPGKVNPVICESVLMACVQVQGLDHTVALASRGGHFELNVMLPLVACNLLEMIELLAAAADKLSTKAVAEFQVNRQAIESGLAANPILVTVLNPEVGYSMAAKIAEKAYSSGKPVIDVAEEMTDIPRSKLESLLDPLALTRGGLNNKKE